MADDALWLEWRIFGSAVIKHWALAGGGVVIALGTYLWGQLRHLFQAADGPDIPTRAFYAVALLLVLVACFLAWRDEHRGRLIEAEGRESERQAVSAEIQRLKSNPQVVVLDFQVKSILHPSMLLALRAKGAENARDIPSDESQLPHIHAVNGNVLNVQVLPLSRDELSVSFEPKLDVGRTPRPVQVFTDKVHGTSVLRLRTIEGLFDLLVRGAEQFEWKDTPVYIEYESTSGRRYVTEMLVSAMLDGLYCVQVKTQRKATREIEVTQPQTVAQAP